MNSVYCGIEHYLHQKSIQFVEVKGEYKTTCIFQDHDNGKEPKDGHLYFNKNTTEYFCHRCGASGNMYTLAKFYGDKFIGDLPENIRTDEELKKNKNFCR